MACTRSSSTNGTNPSATNAADGVPANLRLGHTGEAVVQELHPAGYTVLGWTVEDIRRAVGDLSRRGVTCRVYPGLAQDELGIWRAPSGARVAWFADPDGNTLSLTQFEPPALVDSRSDGC